MLAIAHRGASGYEPENTLLSFQKAIELGADIIELDVRLTSDNKLVVIHDLDLDRTTNGHGSVGSYSLEELQKFDAGKGEKIPTLEEVLDLVDKKVKVNIELKGGNTALKTVEVIRNYIKNKKWNADDFFISSFSRRELKKMRQLEPQINIGLLYFNIPFLFSFINPIKEAKKYGAYSINIGMRNVTKTLVAMAHDQKLEVFVYTVNEKKDIEKMKAFGVDGIISNYPERIKSKF